MFIEAFQKIWKVFWKPTGWYVLHVCIFEWLPRAFQQPSISGCFGRMLHLFGSHLEGTLEAVWKVPWKLDGQYIRSCLESAWKLYGWAP